MNTENETEQPSTAEHLIIGGDMNTDKFSICTPGKVLLEIKADGSFLLGKDAQNSELINVLMNFQKQTTKDFCKAQESFSAIEKFVSSVEAIRSGNLGTDITLSSQEISNHLEVLSNFFKEKNL